ncbi:S9 family peptidase [Marinobacterium rhizophilum]|uniref:S9 family peptidase n=1 Tax=Marinobacterium rhizophilum TaxID=420402 RepID=A0ABY5HQ64_9GAMM|nr:prolyl oligopeptidase family serine peptidase [Marinobacterium rhizophilum]UTW13026.1 S9 family peptidase [Marinobacterium rhizophilum]
MSVTAVSSVAAIEPGVTPGAGAPPGVGPGAREACAVQHDYAGLVACHYGLFWVEYQPGDGCNRLVRLYQGRRQVLTPAGFSVRSRVHEYGGGAFCVAGDRVLFVNAADQQIWLQPLGDMAVAPAPAHCLRLTHTPNTRYGDLVYDGLRRRVIAVAEVHRDESTDLPGPGGAVPAQVDNILLAVSLPGGVPQLLCSGHDFYSSPCLSPDGSELAWLAWDHPHQPWTCNQLYQARLDSNGYCVQPVQRAVGGGDESLFQPGFDSRGALHVVSDCNGWWNLYRWDAAVGWLNVCPLEAEFGVAQWQLGLRTWARADNGDYYCALVDQGRGRLVQVSPGQPVRELAPHQGLIRSVCVHEGRPYCIGQTDRGGVAILAFDARCAEPRVLAGGAQADHLVARPQPFSCAVGGAEQVHGFFYGALAAAPQMTKPPLLIMTHGGPTATSYPVYRVAVQYWCGHGFAVLDLNYRGSAGFGRAYRRRLAGNWGRTDVEDVAAAIKALGEAGRIDPARVFIRGNSAGGYTTLSALAGLEGLRAGASLYGVSDPLSLGRVTHKFESRYLDWLLLGPALDPQQVAARYRARSPLANATRIAAPVIFFQGMQDRVVLPDQTLRMSAALRAGGIDTQVQLFEDEGHGFRRLDNQIAVLEQELAFYRRYL